MLIVVWRQKFATADSWRTNFTQAPTATKMSADTVPALFNQGTKVYNTAAELYNKKEYATSIAQLEATLDTFAEITRLLSKQRHEKISMDTCMSRFIMTLDLLARSYHKAGKFLQACQKQLQRISVDNIKNREQILPLVRSFADFKMRLKHASPMQDTSIVCLSANLLKMKSRDKKFANTADWAYIVQVEIHALQQMEQEYKAPRLLLDDQIHVYKVAVEQILVEPQFAVLQAFCQMEMHKLMCIKRSKKDTYETACSVIEQCLPQMQADPVMVAFAYLSRGLICVDMAYMVSRERNADSVAPAPVEFGKIFNMVMQYMESSKCKFVDQTQQRAFQDFGKALITLEGVLSSATTMHTFCDVDAVYDLLVNVHQTLQFFEFTSLQLHALRMMKAWNAKYRTQSVSHDCDTMICNIQLAKVFLQLGQPKACSLLLQSSKNQLEMPIFNDGSSGLFNYCFQMVQLVDIALMIENGCYKDAKSRLLSFEVMNSTLKEHREVVVYYNQLLALAHYYCCEPLDALDKAVTGLTSAATFLGAVKSTLEVLEKSNVFNAKHSQEFSSFASTFLILGKIHECTGSFIEAEKTYFHAILVCLHAASLSWVVAFLNCLGNLEMRKQVYDNAKQYLQLSVSIWKIIEKQRPSYSAADTPRAHCVQSYLLLGELYTKLHDVSEAGKMYTAATELIENFYDILNEKQQQACLELPTLECIMQATPILKSRTRSVFLSPNQQPKPILHNEGNTVQALKSALVAQLGQYLLAQGRKEEALAKLHESEQMHTSDPYLQSLIRYYLANAYMTGARDANGDSSIMKQHQYAQNARNVLATLGSFSLFSPVIAKPVYSAISVCNIDKPVIASLYSSMLTLKQ